MKKTVITIDGPTGTGKSNTGRYLADKLKFKYIDSGILFRAITLVTLKQNVKPNDIAKITDIAKNTKIEFTDDGIMVNGENVSDNLRAIEVTNRVSNISKIKNLRKIVSEKIRSLTDIYGNLVVDGKDTGSIIFPDADFKFYLVCDFNTRVARRQQEFLDNGQKITKDKIALELKRRDELDTKKPDGALKKPNNAIEVDTTNMIIEEQVNFLYRQVVAGNEF